MLTTTHTDYPAILDIVQDCGVNVGQALMDVDGFWYYDPGINRGWFSSDTLRQISDLLDGLNASFELHLKEYFEQLPKEINRDTQDDGFPF